MKKLALCLLLTAIVYPAYAQPLIKAGAKAASDAALKNAIEQSVRQTTQQAALNAGLTQVVKSATGAGFAGFSAYDYYNGHQSSYNPYGTLGTISDYPTADLAAFYKRVHSKLSENLSSADVLNDPVYSQAVKEEYKSFVGDLQGLNAKMADAVRGFIRGQRDTYVLEDVNRTAAEILPVLTRFEAQFPMAKAVQAMKQNLKYYGAAVMRMPFFEEKVESAFAYDKASFNLSPLAEVPEEDALAINDFSLPEQLRLAVVHDEKNVFNFFRTARQNGFLPASWQVDVFENTADFMQAHRATPYQLIVSDRGLDDTFDKLVLTLRTHNDQTPVIAHTAGISYDTQLLYDKGYCAVFPIMLEHPTELDLVFKKYFYYAHKGLLPPVK